MENTDITNTRKASGASIDTALHCLVATAKIHGLPADVEQMRRAYVTGTENMDDTTLLRAGRDIGLKTRVVYPKGQLVPKLPLPFIAQLQNGNYIVIMRIDDDRIIILDPYQKHPLAIKLDKFWTAWNGKVILLAKKVQSESQIKRFGIQWFLPVILRYKQFFGQVLFLSLVLQVFGLATPLFTQFIIDKVLVHRSLSTLDVLILGISIVTLFQAWITGLRSYLFSHTTTKVDVTLSSQLFRHIASLPLRYFETWQVGEVVSRVRELETIRQFITGSSLTLVLDIAFAVVYMTVMVFYSGQLSLVAFAALPIFIVLNLVISPVLRNWINQQFLAGSENQAFLIETVTGLQTVKSMAIERQFVQRYEEMLAKLVKTSFKTANLASVAGAIGSLTQQLCNLGILWVGAHLVMDGELSVGQLIAFQMLSGQVIGPILRLVNMWQTFQKTRVSIDRVGDIMNEKVEPAFNPNRTTLPSISGEVVLDGVSFRYRNEGAQVLKNVSLSILPGTRVGVVGRSGSGKSTLTKLMQRLYVPESGRVLIDGVDLAQVEPAWLRRQVGVVLQENFLFNGSIRDNIVVTTPQADMELVIRAAVIAGAHDFIQELPNGYDTMVGERGSLLSGGQRQRIAIARALINDPKILIFDEATSALDYESERIIMDNLDKIAQDRTMFMIAHRLSTVRRCDIIVVMDRGTIVEMGSPEELLRQQGSYYHLYQQQTG